MTEQPKKCWARRHMTPSQYVTYDAMLHMRGKAPGAPVCYAPVLKIANYTDLSKSTTENNIKALLALGWLTPAPDSFERWSNSGRWVSKQYLVRDNTHEHCADCPPFKYDIETGENLVPDDDRAQRFGHRP